MIKSRANTKIRIASSTGKGRFTKGGMSVARAAANGTVGANIGQKAASSRTQATR